MPALSPLRARLAGVSHSYAIAIRRRAATGRNQFVIRTGDPMQPFRVTETCPANGEELLLCVV
ncbi:hypothetical protein [Sphingobium sp. 15-1]|uniref:hypothetical protein n=1 Tax=Sphingobium sp. 15-1 TaxID=2729616 RepID=UPI00159C1DFC|nr:hypothetical protein [Sphingobium sp. 15-1]